MSVLDAAKTALGIPQTNRFTNLSEITGPSIKPSVSSGGCGGSYTQGQYANTGAGTQSSYARGGAEGDGVPPTKTIDLDQEKIRFEKELASRRAGEVPTQSSYARGGAEGDGVYKQGAYKGVTERIGENGVVPGSGVNDPKVEQKTTVTVTKSVYDPLSGKIRTEEVGTVDVDKNGKLSLTEGTSDEVKKTLTGQTLSIRRDDNGTPVLAQTTSNGSVVLAKEQTPKNTTPSKEYSQSSYARGGAEGDGVLGSDETTKAALQSGTIKSAQVADIHGDLHTVTNPDDINSNGIYDPKKPTETATAQTVNNPGAGFPTGDQKKEIQYGPGTKLVGKTTYDELFKAVKGTS